MSSQRLYYRIVLTIGLLVLVGSGTWCLLLFWRHQFLWSQYPGFYWVFVGPSVPANSFIEQSLALLFYLWIGTGPFLFLHLFMGPDPEEKGQHRMSVNELRDATILLGVAIGLVVALRLGIAVFFIDFVTMEDAGSFSTERHVYHLSHYNISGFSDGIPYGLIECDGLDVVCRQVELVVMGSEDATLRYDEVTSMLYVEGDGQVHYSYQLEK